MNATEAEISGLLEAQAEAIRSKDIDRLMSLYSADVTYFDVVPPLRFAGAAALRERFTRWFEGFEGAIGMDTRDVAISVVGDIAFAHFLSKTSGKLTNGRQVGSWVRATSCCVRRNGGWVITHEHISLPVNPATGLATMDLEP
jgi:ketosteroid isomerase-like protein